MKGFGNNFRADKKATEKKVKSIQKDKLITNALSLHSKGKIKEASEIYNFLIKNKIDDPRIFNNLGSIYSQIKQFDKAYVAQQYVDLVLGIDQEELVTGKPDKQTFEKCNKNLAFFGISPIEAPRWL